MRWGLLLVAVLLLGCEVRGRDGTPCLFEGTVLHPSWRCDPGLVCNTARDPELCERPNVGDAGAPCGSDLNCKPELWCPLEERCAARLREGEACPAGVGCEAGLRCEKLEDAGIVCLKP